jgi:DNA-directed RNA polymerase alpha subunit
MNSENQLLLSKEIENFMALNGIATIGELIAIPDEVLITMVGFGWKLLKEILLICKV